MRARFPRLGSVVLRVLNSTKCDWFITCWTLFESKFENARPVRDDQAVCWCRFFLVREQWLGTCTIVCIWHCWYHAWVRMQSYKRKQNTSHIYAVSMASAVPHLEGVVLAILGYSQKCRYAFWTSNMPSRKRNILLLSALSFVFFISMHSCMIFHSYSSKNLHRK